MQGMWVLEDKHFVRAWRHMNLEGTMYRREENEDTSGSCGQEQEMKHDMRKQNKTTIAKIKILLFEDKFNFS